MPLLRNISEYASGGAFTRRKTLRICQHIPFAAFLLINLLPDRIKGDSFALYAVALAVLLEAIVAVSGKRADVKYLASFTLVLLIVWTLATSKFNLLREFL